MAEALANHSMHRAAAAFGLTNKPIVEKPAPVEYVSQEERRKFNKLFCIKDRQSTERAENIRTASAQYALETVSDPTQRFELAILAIDTHEELEKLSNDLTDGRVSNLLKADYDKYVGPYERAVIEVDAVEPIQELLGYTTKEDENEHDESRVIIEMPDDSRLYGYLEEMRLSDPAQQPSRSRRIGRLGGWAARRGGRRA